MRPRGYDPVERATINTGNKREQRIARITYTEPTNGTIPLINQVAIEYDWVLPSRIPKISISGVASDRAQVGTTLTAAFNETWGLYSCQWYRDGVAIPGATSATYTVQYADIGAEITVKGIGESTTGVMQNGGSTLSKTYELESQKVTISSLGIARIRIEAR
jgi:uncharacterized protein YodC (DUF2158 family)